MEGLAATTHLGGATQTPLPPLDAFSPSMNATAPETQPDFVFDDHTSFPPNPPDNTVSHPILQQLALWGWLGCMLFVCAWCSRSTIPDAAHRQGERWRRERERREQRENDPKRRQRLIERSLVTKKVTKCDADGILTLGELGNTLSHVGSDASSSHQSDDGHNCCVVCLEPFRVGDHVSWSKQNTDCLHVFHSDCICEWLLNPKHDDCPSCRYEIIHSDNLSVSSGESSGNDDEDHLVTAAGPSLGFVIMNGLLSNARRASYSLIGSSFETDSSGSPTFDGPPSPSLDLRRTYSEGPSLGRSNGGLFRVAFRRVSSGLYPSLSFTSTHSDKLEDEENRHAFRTADARRKSEGPPGIPPPSPGLRRVVSADPACSPRRRTNSIGAMVSVDEDDVPVLEPPRGLFSAGNFALKKRGSGRYAQISGSGSWESTGRDEYYEECSDEEDELEFLHRGTSMDVNQYEEAGNIV